MKHKGRKRIPDVDRVVNCARCGRNPRKADATICQPCLNKMHEATKHRRLRRKLQGQCVCCAQPLDVYSRTYCTLHKERQKESVHKYHARLPERCVAALVKRWPNLFVEGWDDQEAAAIMAPILGRRYGRGFAANR